MISIYSIVDLVRKMFVFLFILCDMQTLSLGTDTRQRESHILVRNSRTVEADLTPTEIREILYLHNYYRSQEGASNMEYLTWNRELARMARDYVQLCTYTHGDAARGGYNTSYFMVGENLQYTTGGRNFTAAMWAWYREKSDYNYMARNCTEGEMCGHYTQVVWAKTREVGCGVTKCSNLVEDGEPPIKNARYFACNYGRRGNYVGAPPYRKGEACSECGERNYTCRMDLCYRGCPDATQYCDGAQMISSSTTHVTLSSQTVPGTSPEDSTMTSDRISTPVTSPNIITITSDKTSVVDTTLIANSTMPTKEWTSVDLSSNSVTTPVTCDLEKCLNGALLVKTDSTCWCNCTGDYTGSICQFSKTEANFGEYLNLAGNISMWSLAWSNLRPVISDSINQYCEENFKACCGGQATVGSGEFVSESNVGVSSGYPLSEPGDDQTFVVQIVVRRNRQGTLCQYDKKTEIDPFVSRDIVNKGLLYDKNKVTDTLTSCCNLLLLTTGPDSNPLPVTLPKSEMAFWKKVLIGGCASLTLIALVSLLLLVKYRRKLPTNKRGGSYGVQSSITVEFSKGKSQDDIEDSVKISVTSTHNITQNRAKDYDDNENEKEEKES